jgi:hypothetical protein
VFPDLAMIGRIETEVERNGKIEHETRYYPKSGSWMIACVGRIGRTVGDGPIAAGAFASPYG